MGRGGLGGLKRLVWVLFDGEMRLGCQRSILIQH